MLLELASLSSLEVESIDEVADTVRISIGLVPAIAWAVWTWALDVEINSVGDDI